MHFFERMYTKRFRVLISHAKETSYLKINASASVGIYFTPQSNFLNNNENEGELGSHSFMDVHRITLCNILIAHSDDTEFTK